jgi:hypothetical protein
MLKNKSLEDIINIFNNIHNDLYSYDKFTDYKGYNNKIIITCKIHGDFEKTPHRHLSGIGCTYCSFKRIDNNYTKDIFITRSNKIYNNLYNYDFVDFVNIKTKIKIMCKEHGEFIQYPFNHLKGDGCIYCQIQQMKKNKPRNSRKEKINKTTTNDFIIKANNIHGNKYDYCKVNYKNSNTKIIIICKEHGEFTQTPSSHLTGRGCCNCGIITNSNKNRYTTDEFIKKAIIKHGNKYDYSKVNYKGIDIKITIICKEHGEFQQSPHTHLDGKECNKCYRKFSKEQIKWLDFMSIYYSISIQHAMNSLEYCIPNTKYKADGYCEETNTIYEYHGDLWHGNPKKFKKDDVSYFGVKYGELYNNTIKRENEIKSLGYNLVVMWEYDWNLLNKVIKIIQTKFRKYIKESKRT